MKPNPHDADDARALSRLGYAQELLRTMGGFSSFALSFSIISVLTGVITTYKLALTGGGPAGLGLGWPVVSVGTIVVALAMAELASAFPTAGALYHWAALLGGPTAGWMTAAMNLVGQVAIVAAIDLGCAKAIIVTFVGNDRFTFPLFVGILASHALVNLVSIRLVSWLNDVSAVVHIVGVVTLVGLLFALGRVQPFSYLAHTGFTTRTDGSYPLGFLNAMTLGMWTMTGYDASAHVSEETHDASRGAPRGILSAVVVSAVAGYALIAALTLAIRDLPQVAASADPALTILEQAIGPRGGVAAMGLAIAAMWFCGLSSVTSASRTFFAFSRDGGLPGSVWIRMVSARFHTPHVAIAIATVLPLLLVIVTSLFSGEAFDAATSLATTALYVSYGAPIALGAVARLRGRWTRRGPFRLGALGVPIASLAVLWCVFVIVVFAIPPNQAYGITLLAVMGSLTALYLVFARGRFKGPKVHVEDLEKAAQT